MPGNKLRSVGKHIVDVVEDVGLFIVLVATLIAGTQEVWTMINHGTVHLADLLLLFIYLEVVAMIHAYWQAGHMPVRMPLYIGMVALARHLILDMKSLSVEHILAVAGAILLLSFAVLVVRYGHSRFPYEGSSQQ